MAKTFRVRLAAFALAISVALSFAASVARVHAEPAMQWRQLASNERASHVMVWDSRRDRALILGSDINMSKGIIAQSVWELVRGGTPRWQPLLTLGDGPNDRAGCSAVYDSLRDRVLMFGGAARWPDRGSNDLWALSLTGTPQWSLLVPGTAQGPLPRSHSSMILDSHDRLVLYGGDGPAVCDSSVWLLSLSEEPLAWRSVAVPGRGPGPRARHGAAYCATTNRMTIFGGDSHCVNVWDDEPCAAVAWDLRLTEPMGWSMRASAPGDSVPAAESGGPLIADPRREVAWLVPGFQGRQGDEFRTDASVWQLDLRSGIWSRMSPAVGGPGLRAASAAGVIPATGEVLIQGGSEFLLGGRSTFSRPDTWSFLGDRPEPWRVVVPAPQIYSRLRSDRRVHLDAASRTLITWEPEGVMKLDLAMEPAWTLDPSGAKNAPTGHDVMSVLDTKRRRLLAFGGTDDHRMSIAATQLWAWPLDGHGPWAKTSIEGTVPPGTWGTQCGYDAGHDRVIVIPASNGPELVALDSISVLDLGDPTPRWHRLAVSGGPPRERAFGTVIVDDERRELLLLGGVYPSFDGTHTGDLWALSLDGAPTWTQRLGYPQEAWPPRFEITTSVGLFVDPTLDRLVAIGGQSRILLGGSGGDFSILSSSRDEPFGWTDLDPARLSPDWGAGVAVFDAVADRALFWNGSLWELTWRLGNPGPLGVASVRADESGVHVLWPGSVTDPYAATIERSADGGRSWARVGTAFPETDGSIAVTDASPSGDGLQIYRAVIERGGKLRVIGTASLGSAQGPLSGVGLTGLALAPPRPNPATDDVTIELASPSAAQVTIEVFDLSGRRVGATIHRDVAAGSVAFTVPLARGLRPGLYMLRASDGRRTVKSRLAVVR